MKHRLGRFKLDQEYMYKWEELLPLMGNFVIVDVQRQYDTRKIEYLAYSPLFEEIEEYVKAPDYEVVVTLNDFGPAQITARRIKQGDELVTSRRVK